MAKAGTYPSGYKCDKVIRAEKRDDGVIVYIVGGWTILLSNCRRARRICWTRSVAKTNSSGQVGVIAFFVFIYTSLCHIPYSNF